MSRLTQEQVARILEKANGPSLGEQLAAYKEALFFTECWVAWLEQRLRIAGIDPTDMEAA